MDIIRLTSGLLLFGVAWYALRLGRLCKSTFMGWLLFGALSLLALLNLFLAVKLFGSGARWGIKVDIIYSLIFLLLLAGMMHFYSSLKNYLQEERAERRALNKWELQVRGQWVELIKANGKLRQTVNRLETEIAERKLAQEQGEKNLQALLAATRQNEKAPPPAVTGLPAEVIERPPAPIPEPAEQNGEPPLTAPPKNGGESRPVVAGFDTELIAQKPAPEPAEQNGGHPLPAPRKNRKASRRTVCVPDRKIANRKIAGRKPGQTRRKKPARTR